VGKPKPGKPRELPSGRTVRADERYNVGEN
jgi:hypothetical protein